MFVRRQNAFLFSVLFFSLKIQWVSYVYDDIILHILQSNIFIAPVQQEKNLLTTYHIEASYSVRSLQHPSFNISLFML